MSSARMNSGDGVFLVQRRQCPTCIYRKDSNFDIAKLEAQIRDRHLPWFFRGYRVCHHASSRSKVCCAGFWRRHKDKFDLGQLAQRLGLVRRVDVDARPELRRPRP